MRPSTARLLPIVLLLGGCAGSAPRGGDPGTEVVPVATESLADLDGREHALLAPDRPTVLVFWATWCAPCRRELPELARAHALHGDRARFLGVLSGPDRLVDAAQARALVRDAGVRYPQLRDVDGALARTHRVEGTPTIIVLGPDGTSRYRGHRPPEDWGPLLTP